MNRSAILFVLLMGVAIPSMGLIPAVADGMNRQAAQWVLENKPRPARAVFSYLHYLGNGEAANNLGVLNLRGIGQKRDRKRAVALFEEAVEKGTAAGRYNLVLTMSNRFKTRKDLVERQIALLDQNIAEGDLPSRVLAAERLYFTNRDQFVPNRKSRKLDLLKSAALSGDPDYLYQYGKELEVQALDNEDATMMIRAFQAYREAFDRGNMRGAEALGSARSIRNWDAEPSREEALGKSESEWTLIAAEAGSITAKCRYGNSQFRWISDLTDTLSNPSELTERVERYRSQVDMTFGEASIDFLKQCAKAKKLTWPTNPPFGDVALYASKRHGSVTSLANSPRWANYFLGQLHTIGLHVEKDFDKARAYFERAAKSGSFSGSKEWIEYLNRLQPH